MVNEMRNRGFSIVEVMFAIMILGVGFIMVAAIFPVAIQQSQANVDESTGRSVAMTGAVQTANALRMVLPANQAALTTLNGTVAEFRRVAEILPAASAVQELINTSSIYQGDPRFGWTSFYQFDPANALKPYSLITVALRARTFSEQITLVDAIGYSGFPGADAWQKGNDAYDNAAIRCRADFVPIPGTPGRVVINIGDPNTLQAKAAITEGAILIVRNHADAGAARRIYYISQYDATTLEWELDPKSDALPSTLANVEVYLLGRGLQKPNAQFDPPAPDGTGTNPREGVSQVVGVYRMTSALP